MRMIMFFPYLRRLEKQTVRLSALSLSVMTSSTVFHLVLQTLKDFFTNAYITVFSRIFHEVVQQIVQLNTLKVNLFVGKPTERFFVSGQFIGKFIVDRIGKTYLLLLEYIGIDVRCYPYIAVTEVFGDHFQVNSAVQQKCSVTMSQLM